MACRGSSTPVCRQSTGGRGACRLLVSFNHTITDDLAETCSSTGWFNKGHPSSKFLEFLHGGGALIGELDYNWKVSGSGLYIYPDWHTALVGEWVGGKMVSGVEGEDRGMQFVDKMPSFQVEITGKKKFHYDPGTETR